MKNHSPTFFLALVNKKRTYGLTTALVIALLLSGAAFSWTAEKVKFTASVKESIIYTLPHLAAQEAGFYAKNGLEVEYAPFKAGSLMYKAVVAGEFKIGMTWATTELPARAGGVPTILVSDLHPDRTRFWVLKDSPVRKAADLKGTKIGVLRFGTGAHALARMTVDALGLEKDVRFVSTGGVTENVAALKAKAIDASVQAYEIMAGLEAQGLVRQLVDVDELRPKEWYGYVMFARRDFSGSKPEVVKKMVQAILQGSRYVMDNRPWALEKMKSLFYQSPEAARIIYEGFQYSRDGRMTSQGMENMRNFLVKYGIVAKDKVPPPEDLYTNRFTG